MRRGPAGAALASPLDAPGPLNRPADSGDPLRSCLDVGLRRGRHRAWGTLRMLTVLDEYTKEVHFLRPERRIGSAGVIALVKKAIGAHAAPEFIRSDNGAEFIAHDLQRWLADQHMNTIYITPAIP